MSLDLDTLIQECETRGQPIPSTCPELFSCYQYGVSRGLTNKQMGIALRRSLYLQWSKQQIQAAMLLPTIDFTNMLCRDILRLAQSH